MFYIYVLLVSASSIMPSERPAFSCDITTNFMTLDLSSGLPGNWLITRQEEGRFIQDGDRIEAWTTRRESKDGKLEEDGFEGRMFWNGNYLGMQQRPTSPNEQHDYLAFTTRTVRDELRNSAGYGSFLDGYTYSTEPGRGVYEILSDGAASLEQVGEEVIDGHPCKMFKVITDARTVTAWVDPTLNGCCRRYEILRDKKLHPAYKALGDEEAGQTLRYLVELSYSGAQAFPVATEGVCLVERSDSAGRLILSTRVEAKRTNIQFTPDLTAQKAFMFNLPAGHFVNNLDAPIHFVWTGENLRPFFDETAMASIEQQVKNTEVVPPGSAVANSSSALPAVQSAVQATAAVTEPGNGEKTQLWFIGVLGGVALAAGLAVVWVASRRFGPGK